jgi:hypothetical protein
MPWEIVPEGTPLVHISFKYPSSPGPYPFSAATPIEGGTSINEDHALMVNPSTCTLYELFQADWNDGSPTATSGYIWNLKTNALPPAGWAAASGSAIAILPALVNYDEVASGLMDHAIRFYANCTQPSDVWPATHDVLVAPETSNCPPMGARFRLNASFTLPAAKCGAFCQTVITTMKTYGLILADRGPSWYIQGVADPRWTNVETYQLRNIPASQFVVVNDACLQVSATSGQAYQPGTAAYTKSCG